MQVTGLGRLVIPPETALVIPPCNHRLILRSRRAALCRALATLKPLSESVVGVELFELFEQERG